MQTKIPRDWQTANQRHLMAAIREVEGQLIAFGNGARPAGNEGQRGPTGNEGQGVVSSVEEAPFFSRPFALDTLVAVLGLSSFERFILLLCAGIELDTDMGQLIAGLQNGSSGQNGVSLQGPSSRTFPCFSLALATCPDAHWSALSPDAPLRHWRLVEPLESTSVQLITTRPLKIDENILFYLTGVEYPDDRLGSIVRSVPPTPTLVDSQQALADRILNTFAQRSANIQLPLVCLNGTAAEDKTAVAAYTCSVAGIRLYTLPSMSVPRSTQAITEWTRIWNRHAALQGCGLYLDVSDTDVSDKSRTMELAHFIALMQGWFFLGTDQWSPLLNQPKMTLDVQKPSYAEQVMLWKVRLGKAGAVEMGSTGGAEGAGNAGSTAWDHTAARLVSQFNLSAQAISEIGDDPPQEGSPASLEQRIWKACCRYTRPHIDELIQRLKPVARWEDIVLPREQVELLQEMVAQVRQRSRVYGEWGFAASSARGLGISALFTGESGTGKTMASEVLANELELDLYRVDLSQVVNKYIGETEKNLKRIFDAAEDGGAILLFDEADALFGKRSEVKDSHDRYGNIEVSYLLQRMEAYRGLAILTTNMKSALDKAFYRRIRFIVPFPFPDAPLRSAIWRRVFPPGTPTKDLDETKLSRLNIPGGNIRNIALNAAFIAAHEGTPVQMAHISKAIRGEYNKLEKPLNAIGAGGL
jgi:hypothetical protein